MANTKTAADATIDSLLSTNTMGDITGDELRQTLKSNTAFTEAVNQKTVANATAASDADTKAQGAVDKNVEQDAAIEANATVANRADGAVGALNDRIDGIVDMASGLTPDQVRDATAARMLNTEFRMAQLDLNTGYRRDIGTNTTDISGLRTTTLANTEAARIAQETADGAVLAINDGENGILGRLATNEANFMNHRTMDFLPLKAVVGDADADTGLAGDNKANKRALEAATEDRARIEEKADEALRLQEEGATTVQDFLDPHTTTEPITPGIQYRGTGAGTPGLIQNQAFGQFTIPAINLDNVTAGTPIRLSNAYLFPGLTGTTVGFNPEFHYVIEQGNRRIVGDGEVGSTNNFANEWAATDNVDSFTVLNTNRAVTGTDIIVRWAALYRGVDATLEPRITGFDVDFEGEFYAPVAAIAHNEFDGEIAGLKDADRLLEAGVAANAVKNAAQDNRLTGLEDRVSYNRAAVDTDGVQIVRAAGISETQDLVEQATALNNTLGRNGEPFARRYNPANTGDATQFIRRMQGDNPVFNYGAGRMAEVFEGNLIAFADRPATTETTVEDTVSLTTSNGQGTRTNRLVIPFGVNSRAEDFTATLSRGYPARDTALVTSDNFAFPMVLVLNGNRTAITQQITLDAYSNEVRTFTNSLIPGVTITFTDRSGDVLIHSTNTNDNNALAINNAHIELAAEYVRTTTTPAQPEGQTRVILAPYTGHNALAVDLGGVDDSATRTVKLVHESQTIDTGFFVGTNRAALLNTDNANSILFESDLDTPITPEVLAQLDDTDANLGLFSTVDLHTRQLNFNSGLGFLDLEGNPRSMGTVVREFDELVNTGGVKGADGASAYDIAVTLGFSGTRQEYLDSLKGEQGEPGVSNVPGPQGPQGERGLPGADSTVPGPRGDTGPKGDPGQDGNDGADGAPGRDGTDGTNGATGPMGLPGIGIAGATGAKGDKGDDGRSAYQVAVDEGYVGDEASWLASLVGATGARGPQGTAGTNGMDGADGAPGTNGVNGQDGSNGVDGAQGPRGLQGPAGMDGATGPQGPQGIQGIQGPPGTGDGSGGGTVGPQGPQGEQGLPGADGQDGQQGPQGEPGPRGEIGPQGEQGTPGTNGTNGAQGPRGADGTNGMDGEDGSDGEQGIQGIPGLPGADGKDGFGFTFRGEWDENTLNYALGDLVRFDKVVYEVLEADVTSSPSDAPASYEVWVRDGLQGEKGEQGEQGIQGEKGDPGTGGGGEPLTDQQIRDAIAGSTEAEPYNYKLKFASDIVNQVALPFLTGYDTLKTFWNGDAVADKTETELVIPLVNQSVPNNVLADIPFQTMPEGTITINTAGNSAVYVRGILRTTHNADDMDNMFVVDRSTEIRTVNNGAVIFNFADFFSSVELSDAILARFPSGDTQQLKLDFVVQVFTDPELTQQRARSGNTGLFTVQVNDIGISFLQAAPIIGVGGSSEGGVSLEAIANEMRADGDEANIPAETLPNTAQITATERAQTDIIVPDNAMFRSPSSVFATISSNIINQGNFINVGILYTDDDSVAVGLTPSFTNSFRKEFKNVDLTRPIAMFFEVGEIQTITTTALTFENKKIGTGSLVDEITQVGLNALALDTGRQEQICTVSADITGGGVANVLCSDFNIFEASQRGATATFNGEIRFTSNIFTWNGSFTISGVTGSSATRTSPDGDSNQVWRFDGAEWDFAVTGQRIFIATVNDDVTISLRGELTIPEKGASAKLVEAIAETIVLDQVASDVTLGGDPIMGGGVRYRTFYADLTPSQLTAGSTQVFTAATGIDSEVTYVTWAAMVLTASTTPSNITLWGGDSGASANDRGSVTLGLQNRGQGGSHSFGIARQTHGNAVRIGSITTTPSSETVVRVSITVRQGALLKLPTS